MGYGGARKEEGRKEGKIEGKAEAVLLLLREKGDIPREVSERIMSEKDADVLEDWLKAASRAGNMEQFRKDSKLLT